GRQNCSLPEFPFLLPCWVSSWRRFSTICARSFPTKSRTLSAAFITQFSINITLMNSIRFCSSSRWWTARAAFSGTAWTRARYPRVLARDFVACLRAVGAFAGTPSTRAGGLSVRGERSLDSNSEHSLPHGCGRNLHVAVGADHLPHSALCLDLMEVDPRAGK